MKHSIFFNILNEFADALQKALELLNRIESCPVNIFHYLSNHGSRSTFCIELNFKFIFSRAHKQPNVDGFNRIKIETIITVGDKQKCIRLRFRILKFTYLQKISNRENFEIISWQEIDFCKILAKF